MRALCAVSVGIMFSLAGCETIEQTSLKNDESLTLAFNPVAEAGIQQVERISERWDPSDPETWRGIGSELQRLEALNRGYQTSLSQFSESSPVSLQLETQIADFTARMNADHEMAYSANETSVYVSNYPVDVVPGLTAVREKLRSFSDADLLARAIAINGRAPASLKLTEKSEAEQSGLIYVSRTVTDRPDYPSTPVWRRVELASQLAQSGLSETAIQTLEVYPPLTDSKAGLTANIAALGPQIFYTFRTGEAQCNLSRISARPSRRKVGEIEVSNPEIARLQQALSKTINTYADAEAGIVLLNNDIRQTQRNLNRVAAEIADLDTDLKAAGDRTARAEKVVADIVAKNEDEEREFSACLKARAAAQTAESTADPAVCIAPSPVDSYNQKRAVSEAENEERIIQGNLRRATNNAATERTRQRDQDSELAKLEASLRKLNGERQILELNLSTIEPLVWEPVYTEYEFDTHAYSCRRQDGFDVLVRDYDGRVSATQVLLEQTKNLKFSVHEGVNSEDKDYESLKTQNEQAFETEARFFDGRDRRYVDVSTFHKQFQAFAAEKAHPAMTANEYALFLEDLPGR